ncbi:MAG: hypothetical protein PVJ53_00215 [Desulfobacterales bacterium]
MQMIFKSIGLLVALIIGSASVSMAATPLSKDGIFSVDTDARYSCANESLVQKSKAVALFSAKFKAVNLAAKYLTHMGLLEHFQAKQGEIFCLAANEIKAAVTEEKFDRTSGAYYVRIKAEVTNVDFVQAQIKNLALEEEEAAFSYSEEMEQPVIPDIDPGRELSRACRYIRKKQWRIAMIYLGHLEQKYPCWGDLYLVKAIACFGMNASDQMLKALKKACRYDNQEACRELQSLSF